MGKRVIIVTGSPRKNGNTRRVASWVAEKLEGTGNTVEIVDAARLKYVGQGCVACMRCQSSLEYFCSIQDEATPIIARLPQFDVVVFATPIYWVGPSAQLKVFLDRTFCLTKPSSEPDGGMMTASTGKVMGLLATAGGGMDDGLSQTEAMFKVAAGFIDSRFESLLIPGAPENPDEMDLRMDIKAQAEAFASRLVS